MSAVTYKSITIADFHYSTQNVVRDNSVDFILSFRVIIFFTQCSLFHVTKLAAFFNLLSMSCMLPKNFYLCENWIVVCPSTRTLSFFVLFPQTLMESKTDPMTAISLAEHLDCSCIQKHDDSRRKILYLVICYVSVNSLVSR